MELPATVGQAGGALHYFASDETAEKLATAKGEVVVSDIRRHPTEALTIVFLIEAAKRSAGKLVRSDSSDVGEKSSGKRRELLARAMSEEELGRWLGAAAQRV